jgi:hypothetical protein
MWFRRCSVAGIQYLEDRGRMLQLLADCDERNSIIVDTFTVSGSVFSVIICICFCIFQYFSIEAYRSSESCENGCHEEMVKYK